MICPDDFCQAEIPDDSLYCDQCGGKILRCEKCGATGNSKYCTKCGGPMVFTKGIQNVSDTTVQSNPQIVETEPKNSVSQPSTAGADVKQPEPQKESCQLCSSKGIILNAKDGSLIGRTTGDFERQLKTIKTISGRHAQISKNDNKWFIADLGSTNGTRINKQKITPNVPMEIKENDVIILADESFVVRFK